MRILWLSLGIFLISLLLNDQPSRLQAEESETKKILYFTHEPGTYHRYTPQLAIFRQPRQTGWVGAYGDDR